MIKRIVKMTFQPAEVDQFLEIFSASSSQIRAFPGCRHLELWRCKAPNNLLFTYSYWDSEEALERYRQSSLFRETWSRTKELFSASPEAWSVEMLEAVSRK